MVNLFNVRIKSLRNKKIISNVVVGRSPCGDMEIQKEIHHASIILGFTPKEIILQN